MPDDLPQPASGPDLADLRRSVGISQDALAQRLGVHRINLGRWEKAATVDAIRSARYRKALRELAAEAIGETETVA